MTNQLKIFIADDHLLIREGLKKLLLYETDLNIVGEADNPDDTISFITQNDVDILILDINLPGKSGLDILKQLKMFKPDLHVLILSMYPEEQYAERSLKAGAAGYLTKESATDELINAIRKVAKGGKYISNKLAEKLIFRKNYENELPYESLSDREFQVLKLMAKGKQQVEIANELNLSTSTINTYRSRILEKLGLKTNAELIHYALDNKLVD
ncbi:MAG TPA: response regulator transcription factor [Ignavibacteriaceae bacterium]|nr:response regulator transcription factor [Ignavibacteriaceae bacterium]